MEYQEELFNLRDWTESALTKAGAKVGDKALGMGGADLWFDLDGMPYFLHVKPVISENGVEEA